MGVGFSMSLKPEEIQEFRNGTHFTGHEIRRLYNKFSALDKDGNGFITKKDFMMIPELAMNPLSERIIAQFDKKKTGYVIFQDFLYTMDIFHSGVERTEKEKYAFKLYDVDGDGYINGDDLAHILKLLIGNNLNDSELLKIVNHTLNQADRDGDGKLSFEEFDHFLEFYDFDKNMNIDF